MGFMPDTSAPDLHGKIALVAGATRGAGRGIAVQLGAAGATVYVTGRTTRERRSEYDRPETIEETAELVTAAGGTGIAVPTDHLVPEQVRALAERIDAEQGRLDVLVGTKAADASSGAMKKLTTTRQQPLTQSTGNDASSALTTPPALPLHRLGTALPDGRPGDQHAEGQS